MPCLRVVAGSSGTGAIRKPSWRWRMPCFGSPITSSSATGPGSPWNLQRDQTASGQAIFRAGYYPSSLARCGGKQQVNQRGEGKDAACAPGIFLTTIISLGIVGVCPTVVQCQADAVEEEGRWKPGLPPRPRENRCEATGERAREDLPSRRRNGRVRLPPFFPRTLGPNGAPILPGAGRRLASVP